MISPIENGEIGSSVRAKLNQSIQAINELPLTEIENQGLAIANLQVSESSQDTAINTLSLQSGLTDGVEVQYKDVKPLTRRDGSPLRNKDVWHDTLNKDVYFN